jgi:NADH:ubiquinone oxidoreductase subunit E
MVINEEVFGQVTPEKACQLVDDLRAKENS